MLSLSAFESNVTRSPNMDSAQLIQWLSNKNRLTTTRFPSTTFLFMIVSFPSHFCTWFSMPLSRVMTFCQRKSKAWLFHQGALGWRQDCLHVHTTLKFDKASIALLPLKAAFLHWMSKNHHSVLLLPHPFWKMYLESALFGLTFVFLSSAVVSSNSSPSLKETSVFLKVLSVLMVITSPLMLMVTLGLATPAIFLVANPTPVNKTGHYEIFIFTKSFPPICWGKKTQTTTSVLISLLLSEFFINSMLQRFLCNILLACCGYRPSQVGWHKEILCSVIARIVKAVFWRLRQYFNARYLHIHFFKIIAMVCTPTCMLPVSKSK